MERVQVLIDKLLTQKGTNQSPAQMLVTVQLLYRELLQLQEKSSNGGTNKVSVVLPSVYPTVEIPQDPEVANFTIISKQEVVQHTPGKENSEEKSQFQQQSFFNTYLEETTKKEPIQEKYSLNKPEATAQDTVKEEMRPINNPALAFDVITETPTLSYRQPEKEIHELIGGQEASLNDKLKEEKTELAHILKDAPIKDLRKGIGVNDKFLFINELFRGDESLYERSIKTINAFHILPEAEYWINRELKMRLAWNDNKDVVQHFYQLVRRRFS